MRRKKFEAVLEDKKAAQKREKWLKELEARDQDDREWRQRFEGVAQRAKAAQEHSAADAGSGVQVVEGNIDKAQKEMEDLMEEKFRNKSVYEEVVRSGWGTGMWGQQARLAWRRF